MAGWCSVTLTQRAAAAEETTQQEPPAREKKKIKLSTPWLAFHQAIPWKGCSGTLQALSVNVAKTTAVCCALLERCTTVGLNGQSIQRNRNNWIEDPRSV